MSYEWPYGEKDLLLEKIGDKIDVTLREIFEEEDVMTYIRMKSEEYGPL